MKISYQIMVSSLQRGLTIFIFFCLWGCHYQSEREFSGYVEADLIYLASPFSGILKSMKHDRGSYVNQGELLFLLDKEPEISQLQQAQANLFQAQANLKNAELGSRETIIEGIEAQINQAKANLELAELRLGRTQSLYDKRVIDKDSLDAAATTVKVNEGALNNLQANLAEAKLGQRTFVIAAQHAGVDAAFATLRQLKWTLAQKTIYAPFSGFIFDTYFREGEFVPPSNAVGSLLTAKNIYINFYVPQSKINQIKLGEKVNISCDGCGRTFTATINYISPQVEFTPPVIYSREDNYKYVFRVRAYPILNEALLLHPGQPVYVKIDDNH